jgi:hypothetical protein
MSAQRVAAQNLLHLERQAGKTLPHVGVPRGQAHPHADRNLNHRRRSVFASTLTSADTVEASTKPVIRIRPPVANSISAVPAWTGDGAGRSKAAVSGAGVTARLDPPPSELGVLEERFKLNLAIHDFEFSIAAGLN